MDIQNYVRKKLDNFVNSVAQNVISKAQNFNQPVRATSPNFKPVFPQVKPFVQQTIKPAVTNFVQQNRQAQQNMNQTIFKVIEPIGKIFTNNNQFKSSPMGLFLQSKPIDAFKAIPQIPQQINRGRQEMIAQGKNPDFESVLGTIGGPTGTIKSKVNQRLEPAVRFLRGKIRPEDVNLIDEFTHMVNTGKARQNMEQVGLDIARMAKLAFGNEAETWGNKKLANNFQYVLKRLTEGKNARSMGLSVNDVSDAFAKGKSSKLLNQKRGGEKQNLGNPKVSLSNELTEQPLASMNANQLRTQLQSKISTKGLAPKTNSSNISLSQPVKVKPQAQIKAEIKGYTQPGSFTNTRADQIALKNRTIDPFEAEMDAQVGKPIEPTFTGKSKMKNTPTELPGDQASVDFASGRAAMGGGGFRELDKTTQDSFQKWVNSRRATQVEGYLKKKEFSDLDNKGIEGIFEFQQGNKQGRFGDVKKYFDAKYKELQDNKIQFDYRQDYLPQLWNNTKEEVEQVLGRRMGMKPSFTLDAVFKSYEEGIAAGLKPKFQNVSDLTGWYEQKANKAIADKNFFDYLGKDGQIMPTSKAPMEWVTLDPDRFPKFLAQIGDEKFAGTYKAPKELADIINGYLRDPQYPLLTKVANYVSRAKNITLNFGFPGTAVNAHGINILARHTLMGTGSNPIARFITGGKYMLHPSSAAKEVDKMLVDAPRAIKDGLTMSAEDYIGLGKEAENIAGQFSKKWEQAFGVPLFNKMIPALKLSSYKELVKSGMNGKDAAKLINNVYGGINWEQMGRSKDTQNLLRTIILAPDWAESTVRVGGNFAKAINLLHKSEVANRYRTMMATVLASYVAHNVANKLTSGHYSYENDIGHTFEIEAGYTEDGEKRYIRPYGTGLDMVRLPTEVALGLAKGDLTSITRLFRNRLSIPAGAVVGLFTDQDYRGNAIGYRGTDKYGNEMPALQRATNIGSEALNLVGFPSFLRQFAKSATGQQGWEQGITQGLELPFRYSNTGNSNLQKQVAFTVADKKGKDLYDFNQTLKGQNKLSDKQLASVKTGATTIDTILDNRKSNAEENKVRDLVRTNGSSQVVNNKFIYYDNNSGETKSISLDFKVPPLKLSGQENLDKEIIKNFKSKITAKQNAVEKLFELGKIDAKTAEQMWLQLESDKGKGRRGKKLKAISVPKISARKPPRIKKIKASKFKFKSIARKKRIANPNKLKVKKFSLKIPKLQ